LEGHAGAYDAAYYDARYRYRPTSMYWWSVRYYAGVVRRYLPLREGGQRPRVLEVGCGLGHVLRLLGAHAQLWGIELSSEALTRARGVVPAAGLLQARLEALPFPAAAFDLVLARHVLEHLPAPAAALAELRRVLRPHGVLVAAMPNPTSVARPLKGARWVGFRDPTHVSLLTPAQWTAAFAAAGLRVERHWGDGLWDVPYLPVVPAALQLPVFALPAAVQVLTVGQFIPVRAGESTVYVARVVA
jgi:SAM-dependent methyltransferase